jgi:hypothetical protein
VQRKLVRQHDFVAVAAVVAGQELLRESQFDQLEIAPFKTLPPSRTGSFVDWR